MRTTIPYPLDYSGSDSYDYKPLDGLQTHILKTLKRKASSEKRLSRLVEIDSYALASIMNDLMMYGYVDIVYTRRLRFFKRSYFVITPSGLNALQRNLGKFENFTEFVKRGALLAAESIAHAHPALRIAYGAYKFLR